MEFMEALIYVENYKHLYISLRVYSKARKPQHRNEILKIRTYSSLRRSSHKDSTKSSSSVPTRGKRKLAWIKSRSHCPVKQLKLPVAPNRSGNILQRNIRRRRWIILPLSCKVQTKKLPQSWVDAWKRISWKRLWF